MSRIGDQLASLAIDPSVGGRIPEEPGDGGVAVLAAAGSVGVGACLRDGGVLRSSKANAKKKNYARSNKSSHNKNTAM